jgi:hypothetical protein
MQLIFGFIGLIILLAFYMMIATAYIYVFIILFVIVLIIAIIKNLVYAKRRHDVCSSGNFTYYQKFERNWIQYKSGNRGVTGLKYSDRPGCYIIMIFNHPVHNNVFTNYENIYIGQSEKVHQRVHNNFNGKGKGDIYADIKYGKYVYVQFVYCSIQNLNDTERELISLFNATNSYNNTRGGAKIR